MRICKYCGGIKDESEFRPRGSQCKRCYKDKENAKHRQLRKTSEKYRTNQYKYVSKYRKTIKGKLTRRQGMRLYMRKYASTARGKEVILQSLYKFMDNHPYYNYEYIWRWIKHHEHTFELDKPIFDDGRLRKTLYDFVEEDKRKALR